MGITESVRTALRKLDGADTEAEHELLVHKRSQRINMAVAMELTGRPFYVRPANVRQRRAKGKAQRQARAAHRRAARR